jgi:hypothetical protein
LRVKKRYQAKIKGMVEQIREMARESLCLLQVKIMITAKERSGKATMSRQARKMGSQAPMINP